LEPALILFTIGLTVVGAVALSAWLFYTFLTYAMQEGIKSIPDDT
jgi:hypothetical protein